jgi:hypothetical protein
VTWFVPFLFQDKDITIGAIELFVKVRPEFAATHNEGTLQLSLKAGTAGSADSLPLAPWNGLLHAVKTPADQPGNWTLTAWLDTGGGKARLDPAAIQDIALVCHYSLEAAVAWMARPLNRGDSSIRSDYSVRISNRGAYAGNRR